MKHGFGGRGRGLAVGVWMGERFAFFQPTREDENR